jgi:hypothetical protein
MSRTNVYRAGKVHVMAQLCDTCIFRPGNLMSLESGRVEHMVKTCIRNEGVIPCHKTTHGSDPRGEAICRGFFEKHKADISVLQMAERMNCIKWQVEKK